MRPHLGKDGVSHHSHGNAGQTGDSGHVSLDSKGATDIYRPYMANKHGKLNS
jgi:hypothetical protein